MSGEAVQIVKYNREKKEFELDLPALQEIVLANDVRDCNISVISIAGAVRKGKSFLLSFFLRYLNAMYVENDCANWLWNEGSPLRGFAWRGGIQRHTTGIWVWSKIFTKTLPCQEKVGVMLMDTQGIFDNVSTMKENVTIFSLSTMMSSLQIYNIFNNIQQDDLTHLQLFTEYGSLAESISQKKAFQNLLFLIRDWPYSYEYNYGFEGGQQLLNEKLDDGPDVEEELALSRRQIKSCFENIECYLMPYPGRVVASSESYRGQLRCIDDEFKRCLRELVPRILAPQNLQIKKINGEKLQARDIATYFETYLNLFKSGKIPQAQTILNATAEANNLAARSEAANYYLTTMNVATADPGNIYADAELVNLHNQTVATALDMFNKKSVMGSTTLRTKYLNNLKAEFQKREILYRAHNESKRNTGLISQIQSLHGQLGSQQQLTDQQKNQMAQLQAQYENNRIATQNEINQLRAQLGQPPI